MVNFRRLSMFSAAALLAVLGVMLAAVSPALAATNATVQVRCNRVIFSGTTDQDLVSLNVQNEAGTVQYGDTGYVPVNGDGSFSVFINVSPRQPNGTVLKIIAEAFTLPGGEGQYDPVLVGTQACSTPLTDNGPEAGPPFEPGDDRINPQPYAPIAIYCLADGGVDLWSINYSNGVGSLLVRISGPELAAYAANPNAAVLVAQVGGSELYRLQDGRLQLNMVGRDGKLYIFIWNGCPARRSETYVLDFATGIASQIETRNY